MNSPRTPPPAPTQLPPWRSWLFFGGLLLINYFLVTLLFPREAPVIVPYTVFREEAGRNNITAIYSRGTTIEGRFRAAVTWPTPEEVKQAGETPPRTALDRLLLPPPRTSIYFTTELPAFFDRGLENFLIQHNVEIRAVPIQQGGLWTTILYFGPALLLIGFYVWLYRRAAQGGGLGTGGMGVGGLFGIGRSRAKRYDAADAAHRVTFDDVAGIDEAEAELVEIVDYLKAPGKYTRLGGTAPKGVLLIGAPARARPCWPGPWPARPAFRSSR
jgi:cell division protease FtsH